MSLRVLVIVALAAGAGCNGIIGGGSNGAASKVHASAAAPAPAPATVPQCTLTVVNGYPTSYSCNALAQAEQETLGCEIEEFDALGELHGIKPGQPAAQITWYCQTEMASAIVLDCTASATNPCAMMHVYPGIAVYNMPA